jgi:hypothetical protein
VLLVELALQGVSGFPETARFAFRPGANLIQAGTPTARSHLFDAIFHTLYPDPSRGGATEKLVATRDGKSRIVLTIYGRDKATYRLRRDTSTGATRLDRFDSATNRYEVLSESSQEAAQFLRVQQNLPDESTFENVFMFQPGMVPSRAQSVHTRSGTPMVRGLEAGGGGLTQRGFIASPLGHAEMRSSSFPGIISSLDAPAPTKPRIEDVEAELGRLRNDLLRAERVEKAQIELAKLQKEREGLEQRQAQVETIEAERVDVEKLLAAIPNLEAMTESFDERLRSYDESAAAHARERALLVEKVDRARRDREKLGVQVLWFRDRPLIAGLAVALLALVLAIAFSASWLAWVNLIGAGVAFRFAWIRTDDQALRFELDEEVQQNEALLGRLDKDFSLSSGTTRRMLENLGFTQARSFYEARANRVALTRRLEVLVADLTEAKIRVGVRNPTKTMTELDARIQELEKVAEEDNDQMILDKEGLKQEIARLEGRRTQATKIASSGGGGLLGDDLLISQDDDDDELDECRPRREPFCASSSDSDRGGWFAIGSSGSYLGGGLGGGLSSLHLGGTSPVPLAPDRSRDLVGAVADYLGADRQALLTELEPRIILALKALVDPNVDGLAFGAQGEIRVRIAGEIEARPWMGFEPDRLDALDTTLKLCLAEHCIRRQPVPMLVERPVAPAERREAIDRWLAALARASQVLIFSDESDFPGEVHRILVE